MFERQDNPMTCVWVCDLTLIWLFLFLHNAVQISINITAPLPLLFASVHLKGHRCALLLRTRNLRLCSITVLIIYTTLSTTSKSCCGIFKLNRIYETAPPPLCRQPTLFSPHKPTEFCPQSAGVRAHQQSQVYPV